MKKILLFVLTIFIIMPAFADERDRAIIASTPDDRVQLEVFSRVGYGFHIVQSNDYKPRVSGEFFFNVFQLDVFPNDYLGLSLGIDCAFNRFTSRTSIFYLDSDRRIQPATPNLYSDAKLSAGFKDFSLGMPLMVRGILGDFKASVGAEVNLNFPGMTYYSFREGDKTTRVTERRAWVNRFSGAVVTSVTFCDLGFFVKFYPKFAPLLPAGSVSMNYWTIGFIYGM